jgi:hypothetical protein
MLIGLVGFAGSGKGTVGDILVNKYEFTKMSFADALKDAVSVIFGWDRSLLEGETDESRLFRETEDVWWTERLGYSVKPRHMLQLMGTEAGRNVFHRDLWVHTVARRMMSIKNVVIPDVRFPNEINFIKSNGGSVVRVIRGKEPKWYGTAEVANGVTFQSRECVETMKGLGIHPSEWAWIGSQFHYQINNSGTKIMLESDISHMLKVFTGPADSDMIKHVA